MQYMNYFIYDKGYCSSTRNIFKNNNITPIIPFNNRNTKDKNKLKKINIKEKLRQNIFGNLKILNKLGVNMKIY